ncbi:PREDICTED: mediator of RNA polymerase II transcription subunit 9 [Camelina sativa]|uniref:Mediator of RNA polymerase II transcription subunit 9 n=1 Tax=Camelina sativa TaxID=90675 RepID=A0ABM0YDU7_CAMSA|nr:PREDICTED: mediator of RNA polymerase II transcription subunit 9 [Camelina sativa]XP_010499469.1 PREDICTED: mediator of RNA polymerase II transcription subunit 9 [Camelina sativa]XP_010499470.1 PREDICTED: mediator of RNA polymerase II transcription subunit 9 [Camelina sativa]
METPQTTMHHTPEQQQSVQTPQQQESLASHFNVYHLVKKLSEATETGTRDQNSDALVAEVDSHFDKCQQLFYSISRSLGSNNDEYVDGQKGKLEESEQLLQQKTALIEEEIC